MEFLTLNDILAHAVKQNPTGTVFMEKCSGEWRRIPYLTFEESVRRAVVHLRTSGIRKGDRVAVISDNSVAWACMAFACYRIGAVYVPMYENQKEDDWAYILKDCAAKMVLVATDGIWRRVTEMKKADPEGLRGLNTITKLRFKDPKGRAVDDLIPLPSQRLRSVDDPVTSEDLAMLIYTSGTTGKPKGVMLSHGNIAANVGAVQHLLPVDHTDRSLAFLPWAHVYGFCGDLLCLLSRGATIAICESIAHIVPNLAEVRPTIFFSVPRIFNKIRDGVLKQMEAKPAIIRKLFVHGIKAATKRGKGERLGIIDALVLWLSMKLIFSKIVAKFGGRLKYAVTGGAAIAPEVAEFVDALGITVFEGYGMTECSPIIATNHPNGRKMGTVGRPIPGVTVKIDPGTSEIIVYGPNVMKGYWGKPNEGASVLRTDGGLHTGDMGMLDADGYIKITGRLKEQYKLENGKYVVPTPLEEQLKLSPLIANAMVYGDNRPFNVAIIAMLPETLKERFGIEHAVDVRVTLQHVIDEVSSEISRLSSEWKSYERIRTFAVIVEDFTQENGLLTPSLKLRRRAAYERFAPLIESLYEGKSTAAPPREAADG